MNWLLGKSEEKMNAKIEQKVKHLLLSFLQVRDPDARIVTSILEGWRVMLSKRFNCDSTFLFYFQFGSLLV